MKCSDNFTFNILNPETGKGEMTEFQFDRVTSYKEAKQIVTQVEGHTLYKGDKK